MTNYVHDEHAPNLGDHEPSSLVLSRTACSLACLASRSTDEGVRYGFITLHAAPSRNWTITALRAVAQAKPVNYAGSFSSAGDPLLERVFYTAAYTVRATLQSAYMGSILMDRGDREATQQLTQTLPTDLAPLASSPPPPLLCPHVPGFSWTGDAHPSQATALALFAGAPAIVINNLNRSKSDCQGIATYCLYFVLSVADYFAATGDAAGVIALTPNVQDHLEQAAQMWQSPSGLRFVGWDDRLGSGFANNTTPVGGGRGPPRAELTLLAWLTPPPLTLPRPPGDASPVPLARHPRVGRRGALPRRYGQRGACRALRLAGR